MKKDIRLLVESFFDDEIFNQKDDINQVIQDVGDSMFYKYHPQNYNELKSLLKQLLEERGKDADLNDIDVSNIPDMTRLFEHLDPHNIDISFWDVSNVRDMRNMFFCCENFTGKGLENWNVDAVINMKGMFFNCFKFNANLSNWHVDAVKDMENLFCWCENFTGKGLENWHVDAVENMRYMFYNCSKFNANLSNWNVDAVENMQEMFYNCEMFTGQGLENWHVDAVKNMNKMFYNCSKFNCDLHSWKIYQLDIYHRKEIFNGCHSLKNPSKYLIKSKK